MQNSPFLKQNKKRQINGGPYARNSTLLCRRDFFFFPKEVWRILSQFRPNGEFLELQR